MDSILHSNELELFSNFHKKIIYHMKTNKIIGWCLIGSTLLLILLIMWYMIGFQLAIKIYSVAILIATLISLGTYYIEKN